MLLLVYRVIIIIRRRFPVLKGEQQWWTSYCSSRVSLSFPYRKKNGKEKKYFTLSPLRGKLSHCLSTCHMQNNWNGTRPVFKVETKRNVQPWKEGPTAEWNETQFLIDFLFLSHFLREEGWLTLVNDGRWGEGHQLHAQYLSLFRRPPWLYSYRGDKTKVCCF